MFSIERYLNIYENELVSQSVVTVVLLYKIIILPCGVNNQGNNKHRIIKEIKLYLNFGSVFTAEALMYG